MMLAAPREQARVQPGRDPRPSAGIIDSQSVKGADTVGRDSTDTLDLLIVIVLAASVQDRDGAKTTRLSAYLISPIRSVLADGGFAGKFVDRARTILATVVQVARKPEGQLPIDKKFLYIKTDFRHERRRLPRPDRAG